MRANADHLDTLRARHTQEWESDPPVSYDSLRKMFTRHYHEVVALAEELIAGVPAEPDTTQQAAVEAALKADREAALRDVFAAAALGALMMTYPDEPEGARAAWAYAQADAMLEARKP